jgi:hypothetical protein
MSELASPNVSATGAISTGSAPVALFQRMRIRADLVLGGVMNERISPHPVLLPMGEGTPEWRIEHATSSPLPWGEGQGEGREFRLWHGLAFAGTYVGAYARMRGSILMPAGRSGGRIPSSRSGLGCLRRLEAMPGLKKRSRRLRRRYG